MCLSQTYRISCAILILTSGGLLPSSCRLPSCDECVGPRKMAVVPTQAYLPSAIYHTLPSNLVSGTMIWDDTEPTVWEVTVNTLGAVCKVSKIRSSLTSIDSTLSSAIRTWRFKPVKYHDVPICARTKVYIYCKRADGRLVLVVPGLTDQHP